MPTVAVNINLSLIGTDAGPFTVSDNVSGVLATGVPRTSLLANYVVNADDTATQITVTSTGVCTSTITIPIDFHPCGEAPPPPPTPPTPPPPPPPPPPEDCKEDVVINVTDTGYIKYYNCTTEETEYQFISGTGNVTLTNCLNTTTLLPGFPLADIASFTVVSTGVACGGPPTPPTPPTPPPPPPSYYDVELRMNGMVDRNGIFRLYQSPDNSTWTQVVVLTTTGNEVAIQNFNATPGYYYYYEVEKTLGGSAFANAYNTLFPGDFSPGPIEGVYCGSNSVTFPSFQLPDPYQYRSYISFNGTLDSGCL
jgi:hypothetical protein